MILAMLAGLSLRLLLVLVVLLRLPAGMVMGLLLNLLLISMLLRIVMSVLVHVRVKWRYLLLLVSCMRLSIIHLVWIHVLRDLHLRLDGRWWRRMHLNLVIEVSMSVADLLLVIGTAPVPIDDEFELVFAGHKLLDDSELMVIGTLHPKPLGPTVEGAHDEYLMTTLAPHEFMIHRAELNRLGRRLHRHGLGLIRLLHDWLVLR